MATEELSEAIVYGRSLRAAGRSRGLHQAWEIVYAACEAKDGPTPDWVYEIMHRITDAQVEANNEAARYEEELDRRHEVSP